MVLAIVAIAAAASAYALPTLADPLRTRDRDGDCDGDCEQYSRQNRYGVGALGEEGEHQYGNGECPNCYCDQGRAQNRTRSRDCEGSGEGYMHGQGWTRVNR